MDEQDLEQQQRLLRQAIDELANNGSITSDTFYRMNQSTSKLGKTIDNAEQALDRFWRGPVGKTTKALGGMAKGIGDAAFEARRNRESFASLNPVIDAAASALSAIPIFGDAASKVTAAVGKFATAELDESVKAFQTIGSVGAIAGDGVMGLRLSAEQTGLSFQQLAGVIKENSSSLAFAFGSTATGLKEIANLTQASRPFRDDLLALGVSFEEQSERQIDFIDRQAKLGRLQGRSTRDLATSSADYIKNLTDLSRITGLSVDAAQAEMDSQLANIRFRRSLASVDGDVAKSLSNVSTVISGVFKDPELTKGFQDSVAGFGTEASKNFAIATGNAGQDIIQRLKNQQITQEQAVLELQAALSNTFNKLPNQAIGVGTAFDNVITGMANASTATIDFNKALKQGEDGAKARDPATKSMIDAQDALQNLALEVDKFVTDKVFPNAASVVGTLTDSLASLAGYINGVTGTGSGPRTPTTNTANEDQLLIPGAAKGGPVKGGDPYIVGELGPELVIPNTSSTVIPANQLVALFEQIHTMPTKGANPLVEGLYRTFLPGIGFMNEYAIENMSQKEIRDFGGNVLGQQGQYQLLRETALNLSETVSGPKNSYTSSVLGTDAISSLTSSPYEINGGGEDTSVSKQGLMTREMAETLIAELKTIATNTRTGADASKKLVRAQS